MKRWWWSGAVLAGCWLQVPVAASLAAVSLAAVSLAAVSLVAVSLVAVSLVAVAWAAPAAAAPAAGPGAPVRRPLDWLDWEAPAGCPERAVVYARSREAAGFAPELGRFERVRGVIVPAEQGYLLTLEFFEAESQFAPASAYRSRVASSCAAPASSRSSSAPGPR